MNVTSITELETDTPMLMIAPMNDSMLSVVPVKYSISDHAAEDAGHGADRDQGQTRRLEIGRQQHEDDDHRNGQADGRATRTFRPSARSGRAFHRTPRGGLPARAERRSICLAARPRSSPSTLAVMLR